MRIEDLLALMAQLRDPETGCAWDVAQDFASIARYTVEEAYEVADAIARAGPGRAGGDARGRPRPPGGRRVDRRLRARRQPARPPAPTGTWVRPGRGPSLPRFRH